MKRLLITVLLTVAWSSPAKAQNNQQQDLWLRIRTSIQSHLGRPYVWGASGMKSFDCSGFIWRVMFDNGLLVKRTTARKFFMVLPTVERTDQWNFGTLVFFDDLKHVGIVDNEQAFYHAQVTRGTNRSEMNAFWRPKIYGFRKLPTPSKK